MVDQARALNLDPDIDGAKKGRNTYFKKVMTNMEQFVKVPGPNGIFTLRAFGNPSPALAAPTITLSANPRVSKAAETTPVMLVPRVSSFREVAELDAG